MTIAVKQGVLLNCHQSRIGILRCIYNEYAAGFCTVKINASIHIHSVAIDCDIVAVG